MDLAKYQKLRFAKEGDFGEEKLTGSGYFKSSIGVFFGGQGEK
ncbi:hypothetical protein [Algoriphagus namhaensis]